MTFKQFIKNNREAIDPGIRRVCNNGSLNDEDRRMWILNDESLYNWARRSGVRI